MTNVISFYLRFSSVVRDKQLCTSWEKKMEAKQEKLLVKQYSLRLKEEKARKKEVSWRCNLAVCAAQNIVILYLFLYFLVL